MAERYDDETAKHYAAYRPPLHAIILQRVLHQAESYSAGLDIGCGTGYSAIALAAFCERVYGIDISKEMLDQATPHDRIHYILGNIEDLCEMPNESFDLVTFAGSLFYTKSPSLRIALQRVCRPSATVITYDFEIQTAELMKSIGAKISPTSTLYDYTVGLDDWEEFEITNQELDLISIPSDPQKTSHILLSDSFRYDHLKTIHGEKNIFEAVVNQVSNLSNSQQLEAKIWSKRYRFNQQQIRS